MLVKRFKLSTPLSASDGPNKHAGVRCPGCEQWECTDAGSPTRDKILKVEECTDRCCQLWFRFYMCAVIRCDLTRFAEEGCVLAPAGRSVYKWRTQWTQLFVRIPVGRIMENDNRVTWRLTKSTLMVVRVLVGHVWSLGSFEREMVLCHDKASSHIVPLARLFRNSRNNITGILTLG